jgi:hypothetical protein
MDLTVCAGKDVGCTLIAPLREQYAAGGLSKWSMTGCGVRQQRSRVGTLLLLD